VDPTNGEIYIADGYGNRRIVVFKRNGQYLRQWGGQGTLAEADARFGFGGKFFAVVHGVNLGIDGRGCATRWGWRRQRATTTGPAGPIAWPTRTGT